MISKTGAVKVMDFGIARALADGGNSVTQTAAVIGTAQYLSPEQARGETVDARSDVYSLGCVLYEILTGEPPFVGDSPVAVAYQHVREDPVPPSQRHAGHLPGARRRRAQGAGQEPGQPLPDRRGDAHRPDPRAQRRGARGAEGVHRRRAHLAAGVDRSDRDRTPPTEHLPRPGRAYAERDRGQSVGRWLIAVAVLAVLTVVVTVAINMIGGNPRDVQVPDVRGPGAATTRSRRCRTSASRPARSRSRIPRCRPGT